MGIKNKGTRSKFQTLLPVSYTRPGQEPSNGQMENQYLATTCTKIFNELSSRTNRKKNRKKEKAVEAEFYPYTNLKLTIRSRNGIIKIRISDILNDAPNEVIDSAAHCIISRYLNLDCESKLKRRYKNYIYSAEIRARLKRTRQSRVKKRVTGPKGKFHDLEDSFNFVNKKYFNGALEKPILTWSAKKNKYRLGYFDSDLNTITVSRKLDSKNTPKDVINYIVFHELLHSYYPGKYVSGRWCVHTSDLRTAEKDFERLSFVKNWMKNK